MTANNYPRPYTAATTIYANTPVTDFQDTLERQRNQREDTIMRFETIAGEGIRKCTPIQLLQVLTVFSAIVFDMDTYNVDEYLNDGEIFENQREAVNLFLNTTYGVCEPEYDEYDDRYNEDDDRYE